MKPRFGRTKGTSLQLITTVSGHFTLRAMWDLLQNLSRFRLAKELSPTSHIIDPEFTEKLDAKGFVKVILPACHAYLVEIPGTPNLFLFCDIFHTLVVKFKPLLGPQMNLQKASPIKRTCKKKSCRILLSLELLQQFSECESGDL
jgi:hypothetical protein